jgi:glycine/D-amino acid oxidase-like deaminating enzyme
LIQGIEASVQAHDLPVSRFTQAECLREFPQFVVPAGNVAIYEESAGILLVEACVREIAAQAISAGARVHAGEPVQQITFGDTCRLSTNATQVEAKHLVIAAGAWSGQLTPFLSPYLRILRKHMNWYPTADRRMYVDSGCPAFFYEIPDGYFYGFPDIDRRGIKLAEHSGGEVISTAAEQTNAPDDAALTRTARFAADYLHDVGPSWEHQVCMYTVSPDQHFIVDQHPDFANVVFAAGLSGHGFKFVPALGRILRDLVVGDGHSSSADFLRMNRLLK